MSSHAPSHSMASPLNSPQSLSPYPLDDDKRFQIVEAPVRLQYEQTRGSVYRSVSWIFGFREKYSLLNCVVWGGALIGFCLARSPSMNPERTPTVLPPGEWFALRQPTFKINLFIHIYLSTIGGIFAVLQFLPVIRRKMVIIHRLNGYGVIFCLIVGNISGAIVARRSFGGEINAQSGYYILGLMIAFAGCMGLYNVKKDTRRHRKWMLRMVVYFAAAVSGRLIMLAAGEIITRLGTYYSVWTCEDVLNLVSDPGVLHTSYPQCVVEGINPSAVWVAVLASSHAGPLYLASALRAVHGMGLWIAIIIHVLGVELYIQKTEAFNQVRLDFALEPLNHADSTVSY